MVGKSFQKLPQKPKILSVPKDQGTTQLNKLAKIIVGTIWQITPVHKKIAMHTQCPILTNLPI